MWFDALRMVLTYGWTAFTYLAQTPNTIIFRPTDHPGKLHKAQLCHPAPLQPIVTQDPLIVAPRAIHCIHTHERQTQDQLQVSDAFPSVRHAAPRIALGLRELGRGLGTCGRLGGRGDGRLRVETVQDEGVICCVVEGRAGEEGGEEEAGMSVRARRSRTRHDTTARDEFCTA